MVVLTWHVLSVQLLFDLFDSFRGFENDYILCIVSLSQVDRSRKNLGLETIDIYYLQNPEVQLLAMSRDEFNGRLVNAFKTLEELCGEGKICIYGVSSWNGFRVPYESEDHLSLEDCVQAAYAAGHWLSLHHSCHYHPCSCMCSPSISSNVPENLVAPMGPH